MRTPFRAILAFLLCTAFLSQSGLAQGNSAWSELKRPGAEKGLFMEPQLASMGKRIHMVWSGTNSDIKKPNVFHTSIDHKSSDWKSPRAPFFGQNKGRVRKLSIGRTRDLLAIGFQRTLTQGNDAYEILLSLSGDRGWSWSRPVEIDSFVGEKTGGTAVAVEGRQGSNRPEFTVAWSRDFGNVRAANYDISSSLRPEGTLVGQHTSDAMKLDVGALGRDGFSVVFNNGAGLSSAHVKGLIGKIEEGKSITRGRFGNFFTLASLPSGPSRLAVGTGNTIESMTSKGTKWKKDSGTCTLPFSASGVTAQSDIDGKKNLHLALLRPVPGKFELWYVGQKDKVWGEPELVHTFEDKVDMRGFDIGATKKMVVIAASQGYRAKFFRRKL